MRGRFFPPLFLLLLALLFAAPLVVGCASAPRGRVVDVTFRAESLGGGSADYLVLLPPGFDEARGRRYPVLFWLHDGFGDKWGLLTHGAADRAALGLDGQPVDFEYVRLA